MTRQSIPRCNGASISCWNNGASSLPLLRGDCPVVPLNKRLLLGRGLPPPSESSASEVPCTTTELSVKQNAWEKKNWFILVCWKPSDSSGRQTERQTEVLGEKPRKDRHIPRLLPWLPRTSMTGSDGSRQQPSAAIGVANKSLPESRSFCVNSSHKACENPATRCPRHPPSQTKLFR